MRARCIRRNGGLAIQFLESALLLSTAPRS